MGRLLFEGLWEKPFVTSKPKTKLVSEDDSFLGHGAVSSFRDITP
jgi:hypothetical protein